MNNNYRKKVNRIKEARDTQYSRFLSGKTDNLSVSMLERLRGAKVATREDAQNQGPVSDLEMKEGLKSLDTKRELRRKLKLRVASGNASEKERMLYMRLQQNLSGKILSISSLPSSNIPGFVAPIIGKGLRGGDSRNRKIIDETLDKNSRNYKALNRRSIRLANLEKEKLGKGTVDKLAIHAKRGLDFFRSKQSQNESNNTHYKHKLD